jgi:hypothetical protein
MSFEFQEFKLKPSAASFVPKYPTGGGGGMGANGGGSPSQSQEDSPANTNMVVNLMQRGSSPSPQSSSSTSPTLSSGGSSQVVGANGSQMSPTLYQPYSLFAKGNVFLDGWARS